MTVVRIGLGDWILKIGRAMLWTNLALTAFIAASVLEFTCSAFKMFDTWFLTVFSAIERWLAISLLRIPLAMSSRISVSRSL